MEEPLVYVGYPTQKRELIFGVCITLSSLLLCNAVTYGGLNLGFAVGAVCAILCTTVYLVTRGCKPSAYSLSLLGLSVLLAASFVRSDDTFVKLVLVCFLMISVNLGLCLLAGQNRRNPGSAATLLDSARTLFLMGVGELPRSWNGLHGAFRSSGSLGKKGGAFLLGLCFAVPMLCILIPLLISADEAFEGLIRLLPDFDFGQLVVTVILGACLGLVLYTRGTALKYYIEYDAPAAGPRKGLSSITVNTFLGAVCLVYVAYLLSQLAYFVGGFSGILPEEYTLAQYARRGFYEMAWLCAINLGIIALSLGISEKKSPAPGSTRLLCLFLVLVTVFLVAAGSGKMFLYIESYGLTRLRVLTQVIMLFAALTAVLVAVRLFAKRFAYMKAVILAALLIGCTVSWADVDTQVAKYNVNAYLSGSLDTVDVDYLDSLGDGALPYLYQLSRQSPDPTIARQAEEALADRVWTADDLRSWNYVNHQAGAYLPHLPEDAENTGP